MVLIPLSIQNVYSPAGTVPLPFCLTSSTPTKLTYILIVLLTLTSEPTLFKVLKSQVPNLMLIFQSSGWLSKQSVQLRGSCESFVTCLFFIVRAWYPHVQPPSWRTATCLPTAAYSLYSQLPSTAGVRPSIGNLRMLQAMVTRDAPNMAMNCT
jgi:hypothetical protein